MKDGFETVLGAEFNASIGGCNSTPWQYEYAIKDHLGNVRVQFADIDGNGVIDANTEILEENYYFPFGQTKSGSWQNRLKYDNRYLYNGKEKDEWTDLYDYGARYYDSSIGRFMSVDPMAAAFSYQSTYCYAANNPIRLIDFMGLSPREYVGGLHHLFSALEQDDIFKTSGEGDSVDNEYVKDKTTGELTKIGNVGGDEFDIVYDGTVNNDGSVTVVIGSEKVLEVLENYVEDFTPQTQDENPTPGVRNIDGSYTSFTEWADSNPLSDMAGLKAGLKSVLLGGGISYAVSKGKIKPTIWGVVIGFFVNSYTTSVKNGKAWRNSMTPREKKAAKASGKRARQMLKDYYGDEEGRN